MRFPVRLSLEFLSPAYFEVEFEFDDELEEETFGEYVSDIPKRRVVWYGAGTLKPCEENQLADGVPRR